MKQLLYLLLVVPIFIVGCGENGGIITPPEEEVTDRVNLTVKIGYSQSLLNREESSLLSKSRGIKRVQLNDIDTIKLSIFDNKKTHLSNKQFNKNDSGTWELEVYNLPTNTDITFIAEAFNSDGYRILHGELKEKISTNSSNIIIPLSLSKSEVTVSLPTIRNIYGGDSNDENITVKSVTFSIVNPNSEKVEWKLTPDKALGNYGYFDKTSGQLDFTYKNQIDFTIYFNITNQFVESLDSTKLYFKHLSFENRIDINTSVGDVTTTFFKLYEEYNSLEVSIAPIVDNIYLLRQNNDITVNAIIDSKLLKSETCSNSFNDLFNDNFNISNRTFEDLFNHFYKSTDKKLDTVEIIDSLKIDILEDSNLSKFLNYDINKTFESILKDHQLEYVLDAKWQKLYAFLTDDGFVEMLDYYKSDDKDFLVALKNFYRDDNNFTTILSNYEEQFGVQGFADLVNYMINSQESILLTDYSVEDRNFSQNGDYYYLKFGAEDNISKENLHILIDRIKNDDLKEFLSKFNESGKTIFMLLLSYFDIDEVNKNRDINFITLLDFVVDEDFDKLFQNLNSLYSEKESFITFAKLVENIDFQQFLEYYKNPTIELYNFIKAKYDYDICMTENFGQIYYDWQLESNPYNDSSKPYIEDRYLNPIKILNSNGNLQDKIILKAENREGVTTEYSYYIDMVDWIDPDGNPINIIEPDPIIPEDPTDTNSTDRNTTDPDIADWTFALSTSNSSLSMLYGETKTISFSTSREFDNLSYEILGIQNSLVFDTSEISRVSNREFDVNITAKNMEGLGSFLFVAQNGFYATSSEIEINVKKPIEVYNLYKSYTLFKGDTLDINFNLKNPRGDTFSVDIGNSSNNNFDAYPSHLQIENVYDKNHSIKISGKEEGVSSIIITITDETIVPTYSIEIVVQINVVKSDETEAQEALKEQSIYTCRGSVLSKNDFEYISDVYDESYEKVTGDDAPNRIEPAPTPLVSILSENSSYPATPLFSTLLILYPVGLVSDGILDETFYAYNHNNNTYIGEIKYSTEAKGREFYLKYYDNVTDSVICEKHKF